MEFSKTECKRILRTLELKAYRSVVDALRAQGALTAEKHEALKNLAVTLKVGEERYRSEMRRAANDDMLNTIAQSICGKNTEAEWRVESVKKVPLTPMVASHTAFTVLADAISDIVSRENENFSNPGELSNGLESHKVKNDINLEKYQSSKVLDSLLKKRKNHHQNMILSELENIKQNNNYLSSSTKSGYIEISYDETSSTAETQSANFSFDDTSSSIDAPMSSSFEKSNSSEKNLSSRNENGETPSDTLTRKKSRFKLKRGEKKNNEKSLLNVSKIQTIGRTRNLRLKPLRKYTWNSVEIRTFEEDAGNGRSSKFADIKSVNNIGRNSKKQHGARNVKESHVEVSYSENCNNKLLNSRKPKQRNRSRTKFVRQSKISRVQKLAPSSKKKIDAAKEVPSRSARFSSRNARRRNYALIASGDYDLLEFEKIRKEKKVNDEDIEEEQNETNESDDDSLSDSSAAPIEISYGTPTAPKTGDYDLDGVSSTYTETDDDMKPHTFNLIPASRRLKMLKKRATSPLGEETPAKVIALSFQSKNELSATSTAESSLLGANALKKVLAVHENSEIVTSSSTSDVSDIADVKTVDASCTSLSSCNSMEIKETNSQLLIPSRSLPEKKVTKPKMKLSEASTIENLHSLLSKVKEGDLKRFPREFHHQKKTLKQKNDRKTTPQPTSPISSNCNGMLIEVGSDSGSLNKDYCDTSVKSQDIPIQTSVESNHEINEKLISASEEPKSENVSIREEEIVSVSVDDLAPPMESDISEQLIDIESADIIIGDNVEQTSNDTAFRESNMNDKHVSFATETLELLQPPPTTVQIDGIIEEKKDVIENSKSDDNTLPTQNYSKALEKSIENTEVKISIPVDSHPIIKKVLPTSAEFRYIADADDPSLKKSLSTSIFSHSVPASVSSATATIINSNKKFGKQSINKSTPIIIGNSKIVNNGSKLLQNKISEPSLTSNPRQFVLLKTTSTTGSKSLLKPFKIFPKTVIPSQITLDTNHTAITPQTFAVYSSLNNIKLSSVGSNAMNGMVMSISGDVGKNSDHRSNESVASKPVIKINSKRLVLSQALESSLKSIEIRKNSSESSSVSKSENPDSSKNTDSSNRSFEGNPTSKGDNPRNISSTIIQNSTNILLTDESKNASSTENLNKMSTFFSKNIIRKQS